MSLNAKNPKNESVKHLASFGVNTTEDYLECLVDKVGLHCVISALASVCHAKESHLLSNWQDRTSANVWAEFAKRLEKLSAAAENVGL